jgi:hypothetical protein
MMQKIQNNSVFVTEYKDFQKRILAVKNEQLQKDLTSLLIELKNHVSAVDFHHENMLTAGRMPGDVSDTRLAIQKCRKTIINRLAAYESKTQAD